MDPAQTLKWAEDNVKSGSREDLSHAADNLADYYEWRLKGGFEPAVQSFYAPAGEHKTRGDALADKLMRKLSDKITHPIRE